MATTKKKAEAQSVEAFISGLAHPMTREILLIRKSILGAAAGISEAIKWNAPSFATAEHFATFHLRAKDVVQVVLHLGAKPRAGVKLRASIADPNSLLEWRGDDRAIVTFRGTGDVEAKREAFVKIIRQWMTFV